MVTPRSTALHCARVYLAEARRTRLRSPAWNSFHATLLRWAANCRREAGMGQREMQL